MNCVDEGRGRELKIEVGGGGVKAVLNSSPKDSLLIDFL